MKIITMVNVLLLTLILLSCGTTGENNVQPYTGSVVEKDYQYTKTLDGVYSIDFYIHLENIENSEKSAKLVEELIYQSRSFDDYAAYIEENFLNNYNPSDYADAASQIYNYNVTDYYDVNYHDDEYILVSYNTSYYTGGAHGNYEYRYYIIDVTEERILEVNDLITRIPEAELKQILSVDYDTGSFLRDIWPPDTITFNREGVELLWNVYTITPYVMGHVKTTVPYSAADYYLSEKGKQIRDRVK